MWNIIARSPITGATLWISDDDTQVAACHEWEEPTHATAWVSGVAPESVAFVESMFFDRYWHEFV